MKGLRSLVAKIPVSGVRQLVSSSGPALSVTLATSLPLPGPQVSTSVKWAYSEPHFQSLT